MFSDPVIGEHFFGRKPILDLLAKRADGLKGGYRQNIGILGRELLGKTSLILHFLSTFNDESVLPIYIDLKSESFRHFAYRFMGALLSNFLRSKGKSTNGEFNTLATDCLEFIPRTVANTRKVEGHMEKSQLDQAYSLLLDLTTILTEESGKKPVVILDEFHRLGEFRLNRPFANFGKKIMAQKETMYLISSSNVNQAKEILKEKLSLLFGNFEIVELEPFDFEASVSFLDGGFRWINVPSIYKKFLIVLTMGHPFYLDVLSLKISKMATEKKLGKVPEELILQAIEAEIFSSRGILNQYLSSLLGRLRECRGFETYLSILSAIAQGSNKLSDIARFMKRKVSDISKPVAKLLELDFIQRFGSFYRICDPLFEFWLKSVYERREISLASQVLQRSDEFKQDAKKLMEEFMDESRRSTQDRVVELFRLFKNEIVEIGKKRHKLPHFVEAESRIVREIELPVVGRCGDKYWIAQIEEKKVTESKVAEFAQKCKKSRYRIQRRILIALKDLEINAKLLAKEEKIWIWSLEDLNLLLDLYGKPLIVK